MEQVIKFRLIYNKEVFAYERLTENGWQWMILKENNRYQEIWNKGTIIDSHKLIREQFTGLLDKHGKEIYCGDKLQKIYEDKCEEGGFGKTIVDVAFKDGAFGWIGEITGNFHPFAVEPFEDSEIIGNIHQNSK